MGVLGGGPTDEELDVLAAIGRSYDAVSEPELLEDHAEAVEKMKAKRAYAAPRHREV